MARFKIEIIDKDTTPATVDVHVEFDPPLPANLGDENFDETTLTPAQLEGINLYGYLRLHVGDRATDEKIT